MAPKKKRKSLLIIWGILLALLLHVSVNAGMAYDAIVKQHPENIIEAVQSLFYMWGHRLITNPLALDWSWNDNVRNSMGIALVVFVFIVLYQCFKPKLIAGKEYGTARWNTPKSLKGSCEQNLLKRALREARKDVWRDVRYRPQEYIMAFKTRRDELKKKYVNSDAILTATERLSIYNYNYNNNVLVVGGSGAGKTRGVVIPNLLQAHSCYVVTDPKGEIVEKVGQFLIEQGYIIRVLNLDEKTKSDCYNPFVYIDFDNKVRGGGEERVLSLIETLIINTDGGEKRNGSDPFWEKSEKMFLQAIFMFVCVSFPPQERNMDTVLELIAMLKISEEDDKHDSDLDFFVDGYSRADGTVVKGFRQLYGDDHIAVALWSEFRTKAAGKTAKSIVTSVIARLAPFRTEQMRRIFSRDTMELNRLGTTKMAIFVVTPPVDVTFNFVAGMLYTQMFAQLQYQASLSHQKRLEVPVRFLLDEFATTCKIPQFLKILAYARSLGIGIVPIIQSLEQLKSMYKDEWGVIVDTCDAFLWLGGIKHRVTLEYMASMLGKATYAKQSTGVTRGKSENFSQNLDVTGRELLTPAEIQTMPKKDCLLVVSGQQPYYSRKYRYQSHPNYKYTSDAHSQRSYQYVPTAFDDEGSACRTSEILGTIKRDKGKSTITAILAEILDENSPGSVGLEPPIKALNYVIANSDNIQLVPDNILYPDDGECRVEDDEYLEILAAAYFASIDKVIEDVTADVKPICATKNPAEALKVMSSAGAENIECFSSMDYDENSLLEDNIWETDDAEETIYDFDAEIDSYIAEAANFIECAQKEEAAEDAEDAEDGGGN